MARRRRSVPARPRISELEGQHVAQERGLVAPEAEAATLRSPVGQLESIVQALEARATRGDRDLEAVRKLNRDLVRENTRLQGEAGASMADMTTTPLDTRTSD